MHVPPRKWIPGVSEKARPNEQTKVYYRAEIKEDGRVITRLTGRMNTKDDLDTWLSTHWNSPLKYQAVEPWQTEQTLRVYKYLGTYLQGVCIFASRSKPVK